MVAKKQGLRSFNLGSWKNQPGTHIDQGCGRGRDLPFSTTG